MADIVFEDGDQLLALVVDATVEEIHRASAQATEQPVERGVDVTDHVRPERRALTLNVVISDTPIRPTDALGGEVERVELELPARRVHAEHARRSGPTSFEGAEVEERAAPTTYVEVFRPSEEEPTRVADSWALLLDARDRALLAVVTTGLETYEDMVLIEAHTTRSAKDGSWLRAELHFAQVRQVSTELVDDPTPARARDRRQQERGSQGTDEASPELQSVGVQALDWTLGALFGGS